MRLLASRSASAGAFRKDKRKARTMDCELASCLDMILSFLQQTSDPDGEVYTVSLWTVYAVFRSGGTSAADS